MSGEKLVGIRKLRSSDAERLTMFANNPKIAANLRDRFPSPYTSRDAAYFIDTFGEQTDSYNFCITLDDELIGMIGFFPLDDIYRFCAEFGYWVAEPYWGQGIATEAIKKILEFGQKSTSLVRIFAGVFEYNKPSARVLDKCGFVLECTAKNAVFKHGKFWDEYRYAYVFNEKITG